MYKNNEKKWGFVRILETMVLIILILSFLVLAYCIIISLNNDKNNTQNSDYSVDKLSSESTFIENKNQENNKNNESISEIIEKVNKSVVGISRIKDKGNTVFLNNSTTTLGLGTGFIISENGYVLTNEHVSGKINSICYITLDTGKSFDGEVIWSNSDLDVSIVKIKMKGLESLTLGDSDSIKLAQNVYAIGNPIGFEFQKTVTKGIISGLDRTIKWEEDEKTYYMEDLIQTDATINAGNSGGPLINEKGEVIGINTVKISNAEGIGFAYPINTIKPIIEKLKTTGKFEEISLGVFGYDKNIIQYIYQDTGVSKKLESGVYIEKIDNNSLAQKAGLKEGDIILEIDNTKIDKMCDLRKYMYSKNKGENLKIKYLRKNSENVIEVEI